MAYTIGLGDWDVKCETPEQVVAFIAHVDGDETPDEQDNLPAASMRMAGDLLKVRSDLAAMTKERDAALSHIADLQADVGKLEGELARERKEHDATRNRLAAADRRIAKLQEVAVMRLAGANGEGNADENDADVDGLRRQTNPGEPSADKASEDARESGAVILAEQREKVAAYLRDTGAAGAKRIAAACDIPAGSIYQILKHPAFAKAPGNTFVLAETNGHVRTSAAPPDESVTSDDLDCDAEPDELEPPARHPNRGKPIEIHPSPKVAGGTGPGSLTKVAPKLGQIEQMKLAASIKQFLEENPHRSHLQIAGCLKMEQGVVLKLLNSDDEFVWHEDGTWSLGGGDA